MTNEPCEPDGDELEEPKDINLLWVAGPGSEWSVAGSEPAKFWAGLWHGAIIPIAFIASLLFPRVSIFESHNCGRWYEFGFALGATIEITIGHMRFT